jgi:hypothetical protein
MLFIVEVDGGRIALVDGVNDLELAVAHGVAVPADTRGLLAMAADGQGSARRILCDGEGKLKVAAQPPTAPPGTTPFVLPGDTPLVVGPVPVYEESASAVIGNGVKLYLQTLLAGAAGDPSEKGSRVEVLWEEGATPTRHLVTRVYVLGQSVLYTFPDVQVARDGTAMTGNGSNTKLILRRERLSVAAAEIDAEIRGYTV